MIIGLDVGGTHTDAVLLDSRGIRKEIKVLTDPANLFQTVLSSLEAITADIDPQNINRIVLSTTLATNAIVQQKTKPVGMIVSSGPGIDPEYYRTNPDYFAVSGSIDHRGRETRPIDPGEISTVVDKLKQAGIELVGVVGKFSVRNPAHEIKIADILKGSFDKIFMGHQTAGALNFSRRIATTYLNAAVYPIHNNFYQAVQASLQAKGLALPIRLLKADGGNTSFQSSVESPVQTILSGPAASVMGSLAFGPQDTDTLVMDIGGTTTDMAVLIDRAPVLNPLGIDIGQHKTLIRALETLSIGVGGDSLIKVIEGKISIGPERAGPAMIYGGPEPTPTDALCILGDIDANGKEEQARKGFEKIATALGIPLKDAASQAVDAACRKILQSAQYLIDHINSKPVYTVHELQEGYQVNPATILVLGGPAPYFAKHLERISDFSVQVVPRWGVANAIGAALARTTCEVSLLADTERKIVTAPEENFNIKIDRNFNSSSAVEKALELLREKAIRRGANPDYLEMEVVENMQFNMVRGFYTSGKNIRVKVQVKPGLIHGYDEMIASLSKSQ